jgi:hypothetical protein
VHHRLFSAEQGYPRKDRRLSTSGSASYITYASYRLLLIIVYATQMRQLRQQFDPDQSHLDLSAR